MRAPRIQMAQLIPLSGQAGAQTSTAGEPFVVPFNPSTLKVTYTNSVADESGNSAKQYAGKQSAEFAVELLFDTTDTNASAIDWGDATAKAQVRFGNDIDVRIFTARITAMMQPNKGASKQADRSAPPRVRFVWGSFLFDGVLKSLTESLELFSAQGIPLRATLSLSLTQDKLEFTKEQAGGGGESSLFTPLAGVSAAGALVSLGRDPLGGKQLAAMNGLDDIRQLPTGVALSLPGASVAVSASAAVGASAAAAFGTAVAASAGGAMGGDAATGGFGDGQGIGITLGGGGNFGLDGGASLNVGIGASVGLNLGAGIGGSLGFGAGPGIGASAGLNIGVTSGVSGGISGSGRAAVALPGSGGVGGPRNGSTPGAQVLMDAGGRMALAPAGPRAPIVPPSSAPAVSTQRTRTAPPPSLGGVTGANPGTSGTRVSGAVGVAARAASSSTGLPPPLPPQSTGTARGAFEGIHGVPLKRPRFSVGAPPLRPLAYRRLVEEDSGTVALGAGNSSSAPSTSSCGCAKGQGNQVKGARCACQH